MRNDLLFKSVDVKDKTFCDVGAFDGTTCVLAAGKGAKVTAIDYVINEKLISRSELFEIWPLDIFSEKWFYLPRFDVVSCQGVFYHVPDIVSLFSRLRLITSEALFLEGHFWDRPGCQMKFCRGEQLNGNHSNWWLPSEGCLHAMLKAVGFESETLDILGERISILAKPIECDLRKIMPRNMKYMRLDGKSGSKGASA
jgi:hypothetical protein